MSGAGQNGELETRLRNLIVTNGPVAKSSTDAFPQLPGKMDGNQRGTPQPRVLLPKRHDEFLAPQPGRPMQQGHVVQVGEPPRGPLNQNVQVPPIAGAQKRVPQKYRKFDEWQQGQPTTAPQPHDNAPRPQIPIGQAPRQVLQNPSVANQGTPRQAGARYGPHNHQQQRGNHTSAAPSQFQPLQRQNQHSFNQNFTTQCQYLEVQAQRMLPHIEMKPEEFMMKDSFRLHLERSIQAALRTEMAEDAPNVSLACFGSLASGFGMPGSDMDLALLSSAMPAELPRLIEKIILDMGHGAHLLTRTRVPIIKICESPTAELYQALREERQKWDDMTPEEREQHDKGTKQEEAVGDAVKTGLQAGDGAADAGIVHSNQHADDQETDQRVPQNQSTATKQMEPENGTTNGGTNAQSERALQPSNSPSQMTNSQLPSSPTASIITRDSTLDPAASLTTTNTNTTTPTSTSDNSTSTSDPKPKVAVNKARRPWLRERKLGPLDFPKDGVGIQCDINFSNPLGLHNTTLLRCYSRCDVRVRLMILFIKSWASRRKINSARNGTLSSYGYVLMVLHYLVNIVQPPVCPNLQLAAQRQQKSTAVVIDGRVVHFWRNEAEIEQLAAKGMLTHNRQPLGVLLQGFFHYFAHQSYDSPKGGFAWTKEVLSLRSAGGLLTKVQKGWTGAKNITVHDVQVTNRYLFAIEDPFELDHNVARTVTHPGIVAIRDEFRRAWRILQWVGRANDVPSHDGELMDIVVEEVFDPEKDKEKDVDGKEEKNDVIDVQANSSIGEGRDSVLQTAEAGSDALPPASEEQVSGET